MKGSRRYEIGLKDALAAYLLLRLGLSILGCGDRVTAPDGLDEPFSLYGILNPRLTTQTLLVSPIENLLEPLGDSIDAVVTSTDLTTGETYPWQDSVVTSETGQLDHIFWANFRPEFGSRHRIDVTRSDGETSSVDVDVPGRVHVEQVDTGTRYLLVSIEGRNVRLVRLEVTYGVRLYDAEVDTLGPMAQYTISRTGQETVRADGYRVDVNLHADYESAKSSYYAEYGVDLDRFGKPEECIGLALFELTVSMTVGSDDWDPPGGSFDPDVLAHPEMMTNVDNGYGFVAGGYNEEKSLVPSMEALEDTWFFDFMQGRRPEDGSCGKDVSKQDLRSP